jgi:hypothetical protein
MGFDFDKEQQKQLRNLSIDAEMKSDNVDRIIEMTSPQPPKRRFNIDIPKQKRGTDSIQLYAGATGLVSDVACYLMKDKLFGAEDVDDKIFVIVGVIAVLITTFAVLRNFLTDNIARVIGEEMKIGDKSYFTCDIERICCKCDDVRVISGGKTVLKLTKSHEGCDELIRWARAYEIPVENDLKMPSVPVRILGIAAVLAVFAVFIVLMILYLR